MNTSTFISLSSNELSRVAGGADPGKNGVTLQGNGYDCTKNARNLWQRVAPSLLGGKSEYACTAHAARMTVGPTAFSGNGAATDITPGAELDFVNGARSLTAPAKK